MQLTCKLGLGLLCSIIAIVCADRPARAQLKIKVDYYSTRANQPASLYSNKFEIDPSKSYVDIDINPAKCEFAQVSIVDGKSVVPWGNPIYFKPDSYGRPSFSSIFAGDDTLPKGSFGLKKDLKLFKQLANNYQQRVRYVSIVADNAFNGGRPGLAIVQTNSRSFEPFKLKLTNLSGFPKVRTILYKDKCPTFIPDCIALVSNQNLYNYAGLKLLENSSENGSATIEVNKKIWEDVKLNGGGKCFDYKQALGDKGKDLSGNCRIIYFGSTSNCGQFVKDKDGRARWLMGNEEPAELVIFAPQSDDLPSPPKPTPNPAPEQKPSAMSPKQQCTLKGFMPPLGKLPRSKYCAATYTEERKYCKIITYMRQQREVCESEFIKQPCCRAYDCSLYNLKCPNPRVAPGMTDRDKGRG